MAGWCLLMCEWVNGHRVERDTGPYGERYWFVSLQAEVTETLWRSVVEGLSIE